MKGIVFLLLLLAGSTLAVKEIDDARQRGFPNPVTEKRDGEPQNSIHSSDTTEQLPEFIVSHAAHPEYGTKSALKSSIKRPQLRELRQGHLLRETLRRTKLSEIATENHSPLPDDSSSGVQNEMQTQFRQKAQFYSRKSAEADALSSSGVPLQQHLDRVTALPGQPHVSFAQYAGYVTVNETAGRALFYYFVEAARSPLKKPLVLWLNGGPGCSSIGNGAFQELGPFRVKSDGRTLSFNKYSWNKLANFLFLESPAGVGFSYSNDTKDYVTAGDTKTSYDSLVFLKKWFKRFPQYNHRDFYIAGESYAGHYVPQLVKRVYDLNKGQPATPPVINLKGFLVGNAVIDSGGDARGVTEYWWTHSIISDESYAVLRQCLFGYPFANISDACEVALERAYDEQGLVDQYDIYTPVCLADPDGSLEHRQFRGRAARRVFGSDPCISLYTKAYFNRPDFQAAIHANVTHLKYTWASCSDTVHSNYSDIAKTVIPIYQELLQAAKLKIWVLSGDVDSVVPVSSTRYSLQLLKLKTRVPFYAWYLDQQVGGYTQGYDGLTFVTVRDAGHEVPLYQPERALAVFESWITGKILPNITSAFKSH